MFGNPYATIHGVRLHDDNAQPLWSEAGGRAISMVWGANIRLSSLDDTSAAIDVGSVLSNEV
jgi:hypothetical protein